MHTYFQVKSEVVTSLANPLTPEQFRPPLELLDIIVVSVRFHNIINEFINKKGKTRLK